MAAVDKIGQMTDLPVESSGGIRLRDGSGGIALRATALSLRSGSGAHLSGVDLDLPANGIVGVVGPSGSGKSALVDVLTGLRTVAGGRIDIDGVYLPELALSPLRKDIAILRHDSLFAGSIEDNVCLGRLEVSRHDARVALECVGAWEAVAGLPEGLDTQIGSQVNSTRIMAF